MDMSWGCGKFLATVFVLINLFGQLGGCGMVIFRYRVTIACGVLFFIVVLQVGSYFALIAHLLPCPFKIRPSTVLFIKT